MALTTKHSISLVGVQKAQLLLIMSNFSSILKVKPFHTPAVK